VVSEALKQRVLQFEPALQPHKLLVVQNAVDPEVFDPRRHSAKRLFDGFTVGFVGRLWPWQGLGLLLRSAGRLELEHGVEAHIVIVGDGPMFESLKSDVARLGLDRRVRLIGRAEASAIPGYIAGFDVGYSGHKECSGGSVFRSPLKIYEYMAMAKPVVLSHGIGLGEVRSGFDGLYRFRSGDELSLKDALLRAYRERERFDELGRSGREEILSQHTWANRARLILDAVEPLVTSRGILTGGVS
jgi:glycosyltransferase involved in cell wall biosynthesis